MKLEVSEQTATIELAPKLDIHSAENLLALFIEVDDRELGISIKADAVEKVSTACLQIIHSTAISCMEADPYFHINDASDALVTAFNDIGLYSNTQKWS